MFFLTATVITNDKNPEHGALGEAEVSCWIERDDEDAAKAIAEKMIVEDGWDIGEFGQVDKVTEEDYEEDDEFRQYFEQAKIDKEVFLFHLCPRYPVYYLSFEIAPKSSAPDASSTVAGETGASEARVWIVNECVDGGHDCMQPDFWADERLERAEKLARQAISDNGYTASSLLDQSPCSRSEMPEEEWQFYDDAEEEGLCLVFLHG